MNLVFAFSENSELQGKRQDLSANSLIMNAGVRSASQLQSGVFFFAGSSHVTVNMGSWYRVPYPINYHSEATAEGKTSS